MRVNCLHIGLMRGFILSDLKENRAVSNNRIDIASKFWRRIFDQRTINKNAQRLSSYNAWLVSDSPQLLAVREDPQLYIESFNRSVSYLQGNHFTNRRLFSSLETLEIACRMHSIIQSAPYELSLSIGYEINDPSSRTLLESCLCDSLNPYLGFLRRDIFPIIDQSAFTHFSLHGSPDICAFAIAEHIRRTRPEATVVLQERDSDYYSLFKVADILRSNRYLWSCFDAVYSCDGRRKITSAGVTTTNNPIAERRAVDSFSENRIVELRLFPDCHCTWHHCAFCGINKKYDPEELGGEASWDVNAAIEKLSECQTNGFVGFWAVDEAIPATVLLRLAKRLVAEKLRFAWHVRTRVCRELAHTEAIRALANAGAKHIIFGLESASPSVLRTARKTDDESFLECLESTVAVCQKYGIAVHCPCIIGFPFEESDDRQETIAFLRYMAREYLNFSFNINLFYLDIASTMFAHWADYGMAGVSLPCPPCEFLGNSVDFDCLPPRDLASIERQRDEAVNLLFPWHPAGALLSANDYYCFAETNCIPLYVTQNNSRWSLPNHSADTAKTYRLSPNAVAFAVPGGKFGIYDFAMHQYVEGSSLIEAVGASQSGTVSASHLRSLLPADYAPHIEGFLSDLVNRGFIEAAERR